VITSPQKGPQTKFLASEADIVIYGGAAGGGKTIALAMEAVRFCGKKDFTCMGFRRTSAQLRGAGGIWDSIRELSSRYPARIVDGNMSVFFDSGAEIFLSHLQHEKNKLDHQGKAYPCILIDEVQHFLESQFWYLTSRNRPKGECKIKPYIRGSCNPVSKHDKVGGWLRILIDWWIGKEGYPIPEHDGVLRYFIRNEQTSELEWVDEDYRDEDGNSAKSITFIASNLDDNPILLENDPSYKATLKALPKIERERLLKGNWNITESGGMFEQGCFRTISLAELPQMEQVCRYWDIAATEATPENPDPDWAAGVLCGTANGNFYILDVVHFRANPGKLENKIEAVARRDSNLIPIGIEQEPGSAGKLLVSHFQNNVLKGFNVMSDLPSGPKVTRAKGWAGLAEKGRVFLLEGDWNDDYTGEAYAFPFGKKDQIDGTSGAYKFFVNGLIKGDGFNTGLF